MTSTVDEPAASRAVPARWVMTLTEPLMPTPVRATYDAQMLGWATTSPKRAAAWMAGVTWQLVATLPDADPWRHLSARATSRSGEIMTRGQLPRPPATTGAVGLNGTFGTPVDGTDIVAPSNPDPTLDPGLCALASPPSPAGAAAFAFAADGWERAMAALLSDRSGLDGHEAGEALLGAGRSAICWAMWRRRAYVGNEDYYPLHTAFAWLSRAELVESNRPVDTAACLHEIDVERIDQGAYEAMREAAST